MFYTNLYTRLYSNLISTLPSSSFSRLKKEREQMTVHPAATSVSYFFKSLQVIFVLGTHPSASAYILCLRPWSVRPTSTLLRSLSIALPRSFALNSGGLAVRRFALVIRQRAAGEEPPTEAPLVGCVAAPFDWHAARAGHVGRLRALVGECSDAPTPADI